MFKRIILFALISLNVFLLSGQAIRYTYDDNGNRTSRTIVVEQLKSTGIQFPILDTKDLELEESVQQIETEEEFKIVVYPNPTKGLLTIDFSYLPDKSKTVLSIYDLSGVKLKEIKNLSLSNEVNISHLLNNTYILQVRIDEKVFNWKVIKTDQ